MVIGQGEWRKGEKERRGEREEEGREREEEERGEREEEGRATICSREQEGKGAGEMGSDKRK